MSLKVLFKEPIYLSLFIVIRNIVRTEHGPNLQNVRREKTRGEELPRMNSVSKEFHPG